MNRKIRSLELKFRKITIFPLIAFGVSTLIASSFLIYTSMRDETIDGLENLSHAMAKICELSGEGDYHLENNILYRGDKPFDPDHKIVDDIKNISGVDATIFWNNVRISTTIRNDDERRTAGTTSALEVQNPVLKEGKEYFSDNVYVNGVPYFGQYLPLRNSDNSIVGMLFVGKARTMVLHSIYRSIAIISSILMITIILVSFITLIYSRKIIASLNATMTFLGRITKGDVDTPIDEHVLERDDEIGEMGRFSVILQKSVTELINTDTLTGLYNRRSCTLFLENAIKEYQDNSIPFTLVIGDIDDFKHINDTYGHPVGDEVLKKIAEIFTKHIKRNGIVARWGGEEFLFIFKHMHKEEAITQLKILQEEIRHTKCMIDKELDINITMTFGVCEYDDQIELDKMLKDADDKLYTGKEHGKDQVISR